MEECTHAILDSAGNIVNLHVVDHATFDAETDWSPGPGLTHDPTCDPSFVDDEGHSVDWAIGGTVINGVYTPPPEPEPADDAS